MLAEVAYLFLFAERAEAVLGDDERHAIAIPHLGEHLVKTLGIDLPAELRVVRPDLALAALDEADEARVLRVVVVYTDEVADVVDRVEVVVVCVTHCIVNGEGRVLRPTLAPHGHGVDSHDECGRLEAVDNF